jgi:threonine 3-dehydrogenase
MFGSWAEASDILDSGKIDITPVITHHFPMEQFDRAFETAASGTAGKIIFDVA